MGERDEPQNLSSVRDSLKKKKQNKTKKQVVQKDNCLYYPLVKHKNLL